MLINYSLLPYILSGIILITLLDTVGAISSRKFNFNYGLLSPVSFGIYTLISYLVAKQYNLDIVLAGNILIGMFDAIIGWNVSVKLKANIGQAAGELIQISEGQRIIVMAIISGFFGVIGYMLANNMSI